MAATSFADAEERFGSLSVEGLAQARDAGRAAAYWRGILARRGDTVLTELLRGVDTLERETSYPHDGAADADSHSQYYFHSHRDDAIEYGHFHLYRMAAATPADWRGAAPAPAGEHDDPFRTHCHLAALSIAPNGGLQSFFTLNAWSSEETLYSPEQIMTLFDGFDIGHAYPSWPVNRWLGAVAVMYRPLIAQLVEERAARLRSWRPADPEIAPEADHALEVTSEAAVDFDADLAFLERAAAD